MTPPPPRAAQASTPVRIGLLALLLAAEGTISIASPADDEAVLITTLLLLLLLMPWLVWFLLEHQPIASRMRPDQEPRADWLRFPFLAGGASGVVYFLLVFGLAIAVSVLRERLAGGRGGWFEGNSAVLGLGALYACWYVLLPIGLCAPILWRSWGGALAVALVLASPIAWLAIFPTRPSDHDGFGDAGSLASMMDAVLEDGTIEPYARDDLALLIVFAALGVLLNMPRVVRRWRELARERAGFASQAPRGGSALHRRA